MSAFPDRANFFATLTTTLSRRRVAGHFRRAGWAVRRCAWTDFEVATATAELVIEAETPILLHGLVRDIAIDVAPILAILERAGIAHRAECYDADGNLVSVATGSVR